MQSDHHHTDKNLPTGLISIKNGDYFHGKLADSICLHLAVLDNGHNDKLVAYFWCLRNAFDGFSQFN
jgi:hypothetical protein